eukprot:CAMPEP_0116999920 /NCGR_PEP_ID=MMETSP0472-20121206/2453_1 /TAXON_ID=693140 ORGANISM="Tiarina fusus, Strain LIS" /NCGR_SAMPLE_ID=MMETSP0472 /ASSEMBLY_ACC=CAM_ASM_000603 /LENGTH=716 /DNA_ID=CAMNT_0004699477 /DNA_START=290 /DNA_END=2440 /DNA_ORIENTATION=+
MRTLLQLACLFSLTIGQVASQENNNNNNMMLQSHFGGVTYAGGMSYDSQRNVVYITGQVGANGCFVGLLKSSNTNNNIEWISRHVLPEPAVCQNLVHLDQSAVLLLGTTEEGGLYTDTRVAGSDRATLYGLAMTLDVGASGNDAQLSETGHALMHLNKVQYPRSAVLDAAAAAAEFGNYVYVVSMDSEDKSERGTTGSGGADNNNMIPNLTPGGVTTFGSGYTMTVTKIKRHNDFSVVWEKEFGLHSSSSQPQKSVDVAQMIWNGVTLIVVGSTAGSGPAFGESDDENYTHGFVTKIDPNNGRVWEAGVGSTAKSQVRLSLGGAGAFSDELANTYVMGVCSANRDATHIYVVGMTHPPNGGMSAPFLAKMDATTLEQVWLQQLEEASSNAYGLACGVDGDHVYMAGIIEDGGTIASSTTSQGGDDVFVVQLSDADAGQQPVVQWIRQVGSSGDDRLAHGGSGLSVMENDGVFLYGDTSGSLYATAEHPSELFVAHVTLDGTVPGTVESGATPNSGGLMPIVTPPRLDNDNNNNINGEGNVGDSATDAPVPEIVPPPSEVDPSIKLKKGTGHRGIFFMTLILAGAFMVGYVMRQNKADAGTERALVFSYLQAFDVEDIDVRHSATGGWHGTYVGKLAQGESNKSTAHSSIVKDSLFVDYDTAPSLGGSSASTDDDIDLELDDVDKYIDGTMSYADKRANLGGGGKSNSNDPWGTDII